MENEKLCPKCESKDSPDYHCDVCDGFGETNILPTDEDIELEMAKSLLAATPEYQRGFETGGLMMAQWMRERALEIISQKNKTQ